MEPHIIIYLCNDAFLIFDKQSVLQLRKKRLLGQLIGCSPTTPHQVTTDDLPCLVNHYAISILVDNNIVSFRKLKQRSCLEISASKAKFSEGLTLLKQKVEKEFIDNRVNELKKRNLELNQKNIGKFSDENLRIPLSTPIDTESASFNSELVGKSEVISKLKIIPEELIVYKDLYRRGFYIGSGTKFASDFLVYLGDPVRYHAKYAIRIAPNLGSSIDLKSIDYSEVNAFHRLCHTANKIALFAVIIKESGTTEEVNYWSLETKVYLNPESKHDTFRPADPLPSSSFDEYERAEKRSSGDQEVDLLEVSVNKVRKT